MLPIDHHGSKIKTDKRQSGLESEEQIHVLFSFLYKLLQDMRCVRLYWQASKHENSQKHVFLCFFEN